jgi:hypothetical protein
MSAAWAGNADRRWRRGEERAVDLRRVLDDAAQHLGAARQCLYEANEALKSARHGEARDEAVASAKEWYGESLTAQKKLWTAANRARLRRGPDDDVSTTLAELEDAIEGLSSNVRRRFDVLDLPDFDRRWEAAITAEQRFYKATTRVLDSARAPE